MQPWLLPCLAPSSTIYHTGVGTLAALAAHTVLLFSITRSTSGPVSSLGGLPNSLLSTHASSTQSSQNTPPCLLASCVASQEPSIDFIGVHRLCPPLQESMALPQPCLASYVALHTMQEAGEFWQVHFNFGVLDGPRCSQGSTWLLPC